MGREIVCRPVHRVPPRSPGFLFVAIEAVVEMVILARGVSEKAMSVLQGLRSRPVQEAMWAQVLPMADAALARFEAEQDYGQNRDLGWRSRPGNCR